MRRSVRSRLHNVRYRKSFSAAVYSRRETRSFYLFILLALATLGVRYAFFALGVKSLVGCMVTGFYSLAYALPAGVAALATEIILIYYVKTSLPAASAAGAVINVTVQNLVFCITAGAAEYFVYLPYLALIGAVTGSAVGLALHFAVRKLPENLFKENTN